MNGPHRSPARPPAARPPAARPPAARLAALPAVLAAAALVFWESFQGRLSTASHVSILSVVAAVLVLALVAGRGRQRTSSGAWARKVARGLPRLLTGVRARSPAALGAMVWGLLIAVTVAWDATSFVAQRRWLPTLSRLFGDVTDHDWGRGLVFAAWLLLGLYLAAGWRRSRPGGDGVA